MTEPNQQQQYPEDCIKVLNHGFVRLVDSMGDDASIVQAARVSYGKGTKSVNDDRNLLRYLMRHQHTTPFEMVEFKFHMRMPIFVARQFIRHRTANVNEYSGRYSEMPEMFYIPPTEKVTLQSSTNKQGGSEEISEHSEEIIQKMHEEHAEAYSNYQGYLGLNIRKELARIDLPLAAYTEWYWKNDLNNIFKFLYLRLDAHAQWEIRVYAEAMAQYIKQVCPIAYEAFEDYMLNSVKFSAQEMAALREFDWEQDWKDNPEVFSQWVPTKREREEFVLKLKKVYLLK